MKANKIQEKLILTALSQGRLVTFEKGIYVVPEYFSRFKINSKVIDEVLSTFKLTCVICGQIIPDKFGNDAEPLAKGRCCNVCNKLVIIMRLKLSEEENGKR